MMRIGLGSALTMSETLSNWSCTINPLCTSLPYPTDASGNVIAPATATSLTSSDVSACTQAAGGDPTLTSNCLANMQANVNALAASDPTGAADYNCANGSASATCLLGLTDPNGNPTGTSWLLMLALGVGAFVLLEGAKR